MTEIAVKKHYVEFFSPGTFLPETTRKEVDAWSVQLARELAASIIERYGSRPSGFRFLTVGRTADELNAREIESGPLYYINGKVETREEVEARNDPKEKILRSNMRMNGYDRIVTGCTPWRYVYPYKGEEIVSVEYPADGESK